MTIQEQNLEFLLNHIFTLTRSIIDSKYKEGCESIVKNNKIFSEFALLKILGSGSFGTAIKTSHSRVIKFFKDGMIFSDMGDYSVSEKIIERFHKAEDNLYSGKTTIRDHHIFDMGHIDYGPFSFVSGDRCYYIIMPEYVPLTSISFTLSEEDFLDTYIDGLKTWCIIKWLFSKHDDVQDVLQELTFLSRKTASLWRTQMFDISYLNQVKDRSVSDKIHSMALGFNLFRKYFPEFKPLVFAKALTYSIIDILEKENNIFAVYDVRFGNIGLLQQNKSIPIIYDY